jgi:hypothetical protein
MIFLALLLYHGIISLTLDVSGNLYLYGGIAA